MTPALDRLLSISVYASVALDGGAALDAEFRGNESAESGVGCRWLMSAPTHFGVSYEINPWMSVKIVPDHQKALDQWITLYDALLEVGAQIELIKPQPGLPDMVFTANGGLVNKRKAVIPYFRCIERQGESVFFEQWFSRLGYETFIPKHPFEGAGDGLFVGNVLVMGTGPRSVDAACASVVEFLEVDDFVKVDLVDPRFYHLDTCFCPITDSLALIFPPAFSEKSVELLRSHFSLIEVSEADACSFACNSVVIGDTVIHPVASPEFSTLLEGIGKQGRAVDLSEFMKAGGAARCLSLKI
jgi:N-dimethylarginine dimethylaminohydrolase